MQELGIEARLWGSHVDVRWVTSVRAGDRAPTVARVVSQSPELSALAVEVRGAHVAAVVGSVGLPLAWVVRA